MRWKPTREWDGEDVYIIGGGPSLKGFNWDWLKGRRTIGCNAAFFKGPDICSLCFFADEKFYRTYDTMLERYVAQGGRAVTNCEYVPTYLQWLMSFNRHMSIMTADGNSLLHGYGGNSGSAAIHLALLMGARRVFLLGFDGQLGRGGEANWHDKGCDKPNAQVYKRFDEVFEIIERQYPITFPGTEIINCNPDSAITRFPKCQLAPECFLDAQLAHR